MNKYGKYKIIKQLDSGFNTKIYLLHDSKKNPYILKKNFILKKHTKINYKYRIWKEIRFCKFVNKLSFNNQKFFMKLINYKINKCDNNYYEEFSFNKYIKQKTNICIDVILEYKGDILGNLLLKENLNKRERISLIVQIIYALQIIRKNKFIHGDLHAYNITYKITDNPIKIGQRLVRNSPSNKKFVSKYQYSIIDYNSSVNLKDKESNHWTGWNINEMNKLNWDLIYLMEKLILQFNLMQDIYKSKKYIHKPIFFNLDELNKIYKHKNLYNRIKKCLSSKNRKYKKFFELYEEKKELKKDIIYYLIQREISILLSAYNRKLFLKIYNWNKVSISNFISGKDIEFMIINSNNLQKIINYFYKKLN